MENQPDVPVRWLPRGKTVAIAAFAGLLMPASISYVSFFGAIMLFIATLFLAIPVGIILALINGISAACRREPMRPVGASLCNAGVLMALFTAAQIPGLFAGVGVRQLQVVSAERWCEELIPHLEAWRAKTGEYPSALSQLGIELDLPVMCRTGALIYHARPGGYSLDFGDGGMFSGYEYSSERGSWSHYN